MWVRNQKTINISWCWVKVGGSKRRFGMDESHVGKKIWEFIRSAWYRSRWLLWLMLRLESISSSISYSVLLYRIDNGTAQFEFEFREAEWSIYWLWWSCMSRILFLVYFARKYNLGQFSSIRLDNLANFS